jgi:protein-L-isoaspartate(D-aspartate) O-methyltransferase
VLAACGVLVTAVEDDDALLKLARAALSEIAPGVNLVPGPLAAGWAAEAPYDIVFIEGAVAVPPPTIVAQLRQEIGRLVTVIRGTAGNGQAVRGETTQAGLQLRTEFDCATPLIPALLPAPAFTF